jgi:hypothetical protein
MLALTLPSGAMIRTLSYQVLASDHSVLVTGTMDVSDATSAPTIRASVPHGKGDTLVMSALTSEGAICSGTSAPFDVKPNKTAFVSVTLVCGEVLPAQTRGTVIATGTVVAGNTCPVLTSWVTSPLQTSAGAAVDVAANAADPDAGDALTFLWSASAGTFTQPTARSTRYVCGAPGIQTITVQVSDNHMPSPCTDAHAFSVRCVGSS